MYHAKVRAFKHWRRHAEWVRRNNEVYVFSVARDASLAGDEVSATNVRYRVAHHHITECVMEGDKSK